MNISLQSLKGKTKLNFHQKISIYYDELNHREQSVYFQFEEDPFAKNAQEVTNVMLEFLLLL